MEVKRLSLPSRCEICHKADQFDASRNWCERCESAKAREEEKVRALVQRQPSGLFSLPGLLLCKVGIHSWNYGRWERLCRRCDTVQYVWRILGFSIEWRTEAAITSVTSMAEFLDSLPMPLRRWQCLHCTRQVMRIHPPGYFERCPNCGRDNYIQRKHNYGSA